MSNFYTRALDNIFSIRFWLFLSCYLVSMYLILMTSVQSYNPFGENYELFFALFSITLVVCKAFFVDFTCHKSLAYNLVAIIMSFILTALFISVIGFFLKSSTNFSRLIIGSFFLSGMVLDILLFLNFSYLSKRLGIRKKQKIALIAYGNYSKETYQHICKNEKIDVIDVLTSINKKRLREITSRYNLSKVIILSDNFDIRQIGSISKSCENTTAELLLISENKGFSKILANSSSRYLDYSCYLLGSNKFQQDAFKRFLKRLFDFTFASIGILIISPLLFFVAICIKLNSKGPILFKQERNGLHGENFKIYKFRSMHVHSDNFIQAIEEDDRVTLVGKIIRSTSIDELPQLINVILGDMSLVGPRPHAVEHNLQNMNVISKYMSRHKIKPGITGLAQINGFRGETKNLDDMQKRVAYDLKYIKNWSFILDIKILFLTPFSLFKFKAY